MLTRLLDHLTTPAMPTGRLPVRLVPVLVLAYACLLPRELSLDLAGATLTPYRLALLGLLPFVLAQLVRFPPRPAVVDLFALIAAAWFLVSMYMNTSRVGGLITGGSNTLDYALAYLFGRATLRQPSDLRLLLAWMLPGLVALVLVLAAESLSGRMILRPLLAELLGLPAPELYFRMRYGLLRAMGPFPHPILSGVFLAGLLPLAWYLASNHIQRIIGVLVSLGAIFTVSATAVLGMMVAIAMILAETLQRLTRLPIYLFCGFYLMLAVAAIKVGSESGLVSFLIRRLTLDQGSGYYRLWIWEYGGAVALANPWFGIGNADWERPQGMVSASVDAYWLAITMFFGFPAMLAAAGVMVGALVMVAGTQPLRPPADRQAGWALIIFITVIIAAGFMVHLWEGLHAFAILMCGAAVSLATEVRRMPTPPAPVAAWRQPLRGAELATHNPG